MADIGKDNPAVSDALNMLKTYERDESSKEENIDNTTGKKRSLDEKNDIEEPEKKKLSMKFNILSKSEPRVEPKKALFKKSFGPGIKMNIGGQKNKDPPTVKKPAMSVAKAFALDDDSDDDEMPPEARMRMRNIGRETPTAAGPNSYGKSNLGFCDRQKIIEKTMKEKMEEVSNDNK